MEGKYDLRYNADCLLRTSGLDHVKGMLPPVRDPQPDELYITIIDNQGRERIQRVEYIVTDVLHETIYVTADGLAYTQDSLMRKGQDHILELIARIPDILSQPAIVIQDHLSPDDTLLYYKQVYSSTLAQHQLLCIVIKIRQDIRFFYNFFPQQSGKVKGHREIPPPTIWYLAPGESRSKYGISSGDD